MKMFEAALNRVIFLRILESDKVVVAFMEKKNLLQNEIFANFS